MPTSKSLKTQLSGNTWMLLGEMVIKWSTLKQCHVHDWTLLNGDEYPTLNVHVPDKRKSSLI